jgi:aminopeptidase N
MPPLTRAEAQDRADLLTVTDLVVDLDLTRGGDGFGSRTLIRFDCARPGAATFLELRPAALHEVHLNGVALDPAGLVDGRLPLTGLAGRNEVRVSATMSYSHTGDGLHRFVDPADGLPYVYAMTFLDAAPQVFACFDQPDLKAPVTLSVRAPRSWVVTANGDVAARTPDGPGSAGEPADRWEFTRTRPLATYFTTLVAGPYHVLRDEHDGIPLGLYCRASLAPHLDREAPEILAVTRACFDLYHRMFGARYPFAGYDQAFVPEFAFGAMENPGCVTFHDELVFRSAVTRAQRADRAEVIAHEMAHMWFGDLVTMRWWDDLWLNESFATWAGNHAIATAAGFPEAWTTFAATEKARGYVADQRPSTHPVSADVPDAGQALLNFDGISYAKGASVLRQLVAWVGEEAFLTGLRAYFDAHAFGNATLADLLDALSAASGRDLTAWAAVWLRQPQVNTLRPVVEAGADGRYARVVIEQSAPPEHPVLRPHRVGVGRYDLRDGTLVRTGAVELDVDGPATEIPGLAGQPAADLLLVNDGDLTYAKVRLDEAAAARLDDLLPGTADPMARALLWSAAVHAARDAEVPAGRFVALAAAGLPAETEVAVFSGMAAFATDTVVERYLPPGARPAARATLAAAVRRVLDTVPPGDPRQLAAARAGIALAGPADTDRLRGWLSGVDLPEGLVADDDLRWRLLRALVLAGVAGTGDIDAEAARDRSAAGARQAAWARAAVAEPAAKAAAWRAIVHDDQLSNHLLLATAGGFWQSGQQELTAGYVARYFEELPAASARRPPALAERLAQVAYPSHAVDGSTLDMAATLLAGEVAPAMRRSVVDCTDDLRRAVAARRLAEKEA